MADMTIPEYRVLVDQLVPGVFIRLERVNWFSHPFLFNTFKIKDEDQIDVLRDLGISEVICIPEKSDRLPGPRQEERPRLKLVKKRSGTADTTKSALDELWRVKKERAERLRKKKLRIAECEERYATSIRDLSQLTGRIAMGDVDSVRQALEYVKRLTEHFLGDVESTLHLMNVMTPSERVYSHALNVAVLSMMLGRESGLGADDMITLGMGAVFHDIGKTRIEKKLLRKRGALTRPERDLIQKHPEFGVEILSGVEEFPQRSLEVVRQHHELCNGKGYPEGLDRDSIDPLARMVTIADAYDNLCNRPDPDESLTPYLSLSYMFSQQKDLYDPEALSSFIRCLGVYPPGTVVQLSNAAIGMVMAVNPRNQLNPSLVLYDPDIPKKEALIVDLAEEPDLSIEKSIRLSHLPQEILDYLSPRTKLSYYVEPEG